MSRINLIDRLRQGVFFIDGAMGTELMAEGIQPGSCNDAVNLSSPPIVRRIHDRYFTAGCDAVLTNTFGANALLLGRHSLADKALEINRAGARIARESAGPDRYVLGDIGPCGDFLEPVGTIKPQDLRRMFAEQARGLSEGGADGIIIETMTALDEMIVAVEAVQLVCSLPVLCSFAYDQTSEGFRTMMGVNPTRVVSQLRSMDVTAIGFNCGTLTMEGYIALAKEYARLLEGTGIILLAEPNAGRPELIGGRACYRLTPQDYADAVREMYRAGVTILGGCCGTTLGGCCGTTPNHIEAMIRAIRG